MLDKKIIPKPIDSLLLIPLLILGLGFLSNIITLVSLYSLLIWIGYSGRRYKKNQNLWIILATLGWFFFLLVYFYFFKSGNIFERYRSPLDSFNYFIMASTLMVSILSIVFSKNIQQASLCIIIFSFGMLLTGVLNSVITKYTIDPPYYGRCIHWYHKILYNSPGSTILASCLPIVLLSFRKFVSVQLFYILFLLVFGASIFVNVFFQARFFLIIFSYSILLYVIIFYRKLQIIKFNKFGILFLLIFTPFLFYILRTEDFLNIYNRLLNGDYSAKFFHYRDYFSQVKDNFFIYPESHAYGWFHSFILDSHSTSGPFSALISVFLVIYPMVYSMVILFRSEEFSKEKLYLYMMMLPFLFTTIPWESSEPQVLILYAMISTLIFKDK